MIILRNKLYIPTFNRCLPVGHALMPLGGGGLSPLGRAMKTLQHYTLTLQPDAAAGMDCSINPSVPNNNYNAWYAPIGYYTATDKWSSLFQFDLSSIPTTAVVTSAVFTFYRQASYGSYAYTVGAYKILRNWVESQATWNVYSTGNAWGTAGCNNTTTDRSATGENVHALNLATDNVWAIPLMVQAWVTTPASNHGFIILTPDAWSAQGQMTCYSSDEATATTKRPKLVVEYDA